ncbi:hypothetical protein [uncultured Hymenobacter sp.]|uniref:hypothetical protein n=1 Tax=uncultured Hymenobacter sp. TaxID=170016 RepID=UPI0035CADDF6
MAKQADELDFLREEIKTGLAEVSKHIKANPPFITLIGLIRELDVQLTIPYKSDVANPSVLDLYKHGWQSLFKEAYRLFDMVPRPMFFPSSREHIEDARMLLNFSGRVGICQQFLYYLRYGMIRVAEVAGQNVEFEPNYKYFGVERFDIEYRAFLSEHIIERIIEERKAQHSLSFETIQLLIRRTAEKPHPQFMAYVAPEEVSDFFRRQGHYMILRLQEHENFGPDDLFGGLPYRVYVDAVEYLMGVALMHVHYALAVLERHPQTFLANLLPYLRPESSFIGMLAEGIDVTESQARQILDCLTLDKVNYEGYTDFTAAAPPPFIRMSEGNLLRSVAGCMINPFQLLNYELKRRYEKDYFRAVNNREVQFRRDLFNFFPQEHIIKLNKGMMLSTPLGSTDIDAVLYDRHAGTAALIQLKWPDGYGDSMRRRQSAMTNYYSKANEWVEKVHSWVKTPNARTTFFDKLQIQVAGEERASFKGFYIIVLNRYTAHFTSGEPSEKAAWGSWAQLIATLATGMNHKPDDPLGAAYFCLRYFDPKRRIDREGVPKPMRFDMKIGASRLIMDK